MDHGIYRPLDVDVVLPDGKTKKARVYEQCVSPEAIEKIENLPDARKPSGVYLNIIKKGAEESGLPEDYRNFLKKIPHNGYTGEVEIGTDLHLT